MSSFNKKLQDSPKHFYNDWLSIVGRWFRRETGTAVNCNEFPVKFVRISTMHRLVFCTHSLASFTPCFLVGSRFSDRVSWVTFWSTIHFHHSCKFVAQVTALFNKFMQFKRVIDCCLCIGWFHFFSRWRCQLCLVVFSNASAIHCLLWSLSLHRLMPCHVSGLVHRVLARRWVFHWTLSGLTSDKELGSRLYIFFTLVITLMVKSSWYLLWTINSSLEGY